MKRIVVLVAGFLLLSLGVFRIFAVDPPNGDFTLVTAMTTLVIIVGGGITYLALWLWPE